MPVVTAHGQGVNGCAVPAPNGHEDLILPGRGGWRVGADRVEMPERNGESGGTIFDGSRSRWTDAEQFEIEAFIHLHRGNPALRVL